VSWRSPCGPEELGVEHDDALVASFLDRIEHEIDRRVDERIAKQAPRRAGTA